MYRSKKVKIKPKDEQQILSKRIQKMSKLRQYYVRQLNFSCVRNLRNTRTENGAQFFNVTILLVGIYYFKIPNIIFRSFHVKVLPTEMCFQKKIIFIQNVPFFPKKHSTLFFHVTRKN